MPLLGAVWLLATGLPAFADPPVASDFDLNAVPVNTVLVAEAADIVSSFASDVDEQLVATSLAFNAATIDGSPVAGPSVAGFSYTPGAGTAGEFTIDPTVVAFAGLTPGSSAVVIVSFTVTDSDFETDTGVLRYTVTGDPGSYEELAFDFQGPPAGGVTASRTAGANETLASIAMAGPGTLASAMAGFDFSMIDAPAAAPGVEVAIAIAADNSRADAIAENGSVARADARTLNSDALAFAGTNATATATARDDGSATSSAENDSSATSFASENSTALADSREAAIAQAVANGGSVASSTSRNGSDSLTFASGASTATANASDDSSATSTAESGSVAGSFAALSATVVAAANNASTASTTSTDGFTATSESTGGGMVSVLAAAAVANPQIDDEGPNTANLRLPREINASVDNPNALFFEVAGSGGAVDRVVLSGFPAGTTLSAGTEASPGAWAFTESPPPGLTFSLPAGWADGFELEVRVEIANNLGAVETSTRVNLGVMFRDGFED